MYTYTHDDPVSYVDRTGQFPELAEQIAGIIVGVGVGAVTAATNHDTGSAAFFDIVAGGAAGGLSASISPNYFGQILFGAGAGALSEFISEEGKGQSPNLGKLLVAGLEGGAGGAVAGGLLKLGVQSASTTAAKVALGTTAGMLGASTAVALTGLVDTASPPQQNNSPYDFGTDQEVIVAASGGHISPGNFDPVTIVYSPGSDIDVGGGFGQSIVIIPQPIPDITIDGP